MAANPRHGLIAAALLLGALKAYGMPGTGCFDDKNLLDVQTSKRASLIYVWSPRMVYSAEQMEIAARAAAANGLDFVVVHDGRLPPKELWSYPPKPQLSDPSAPAIDLTEENLATPPYFPVTQGSLPLCADALTSNEALRHFPTAFVVTAQGVHRHPIVGAMPPNAWHSSIAQRLAKP